MRADICLSFQCLTDSWLLPDTVDTVPQFKSMPLAIWGFKIVCFKSQFNSVDGHLTKDRSINRHIVRSLFCWNYYNRILSPHMLQALTVPHIWFWFPLFCIDRMSSFKHNGLTISLCSMFGLSSPAPPQSLLPSSLLFSILDMCSLKLLSFCLYVLISTASGNGTTGKSEPHTP